MRGDSGKAQLRNRARGEISNVAEPWTSDVMVLVIFPKQCHQNIHIEQENHAN